MKQDIENLLQLLRDKLGMASGHNLKKVVLYGSRARGDEEPDFRSGHAGRGGRFGLK
jgi:hypothetical protein